MSTTKDTSRKRPRSGSTPRAKGDAAKGHKNNSKEALFQAIEPMRPLLNMIKDAIVISDMEGNIVEVNDAGLKLSRCAREEFIGRNAIEIIAEKDRQAAIDSLMKQADGAEPAITARTKKKTPLLDGLFLDFAVSNSWLSIVETPLRSN